MTALAIGDHRMFDASRYWDRGIRLMVETADAREKQDQAAAMWALLQEAAAVSRSWRSPPRAGLPAKSALPEAPDDVTEWQRAVFAFEEQTSVTAMYGRPPKPQWTAEQHSHAEFTLDLFHRFALAGAGDRKRLRKAVYAYACGVPPRKVRSFTGLSRFQLQRAKERATRDMFEAFRDGE